MVRVVRIHGHPLSYFWDAKNVSTTSEGTQGRGALPRRLTNILLPPSTTKMLDWTCYFVILVAEYYFFLMYEETERVIGKISSDLHYTAYTDYMAVARLNQAAQGMGEFQVSLDSTLWWATVPGPGWPPSASAGARVSGSAYTRASYICKSVFAVYQLSA